MLDRAIAVLTGELLAELYPGGSPTLLHAHWNCFFGLCRALYRLRPYGPTSTLPADIRSPRMSF